MKKAQALRAGARVRVVAPASPFDEAKFDRGLAVLRGFGLDVEAPQSLRRRTGYLAGDDAARAAELVAALEDPDVTTIWCARGGYGTTRLLPRLAAVVPSGPKLLVGFSDVSALIALWFGRYGMTAVHGPVLTSLADEPEASCAHLWRVLTGAAAGTVMPLAEPYRGPAVTGTLYATNLTLLDHLVGTPYLPDLGGCLVVVEEIGERPYRLDRMWTQLRQAGVLSGAGALVLGAFVDCDEKDGSQVAADGNALGLRDIPLPVARGLAVGHLAPNFAIPVGIKATLSGAGLTLLEEAVAPWH